MKLVYLVLVGACLLCYGDNYVAGVTTTVFDDALATPFQDWSWGTVNKSSTAVVHGGSQAISFLANSWGALYFHATDFISTSTFSGIEFWIWRDAASSTNINFNMVVDGSSGAVVTGSTITVLSAVGGTWPANTWVKGSISLSSFPVGIYDGCWFQDGSGLTTNAAVILDDIVLTSGTASTSTTPPATTTKSPSTTQAASTTTKSASTTTKSPSTTKAPSTTTKAPSTTTTTKSPSTTTTTRAPSTTTTTAITTTAPIGDVDAEVLALYNTVTTGQATYYGQYTNGGECMLDPTPDAGTVSTIRNTVAIANYMLSRTCGMCLQVTGAGHGSGDPTYAVNGSRIVFVNNECPNCPIGNLDFGLNGDGAWDITYKAVPCPITSKIQYVFKDGSSPYWVGLQPRNTVYPVYKFAILVGGTWVDMPRFSYNYFIASFSGLQFPIKIQMTSANGQVITDTINSLQNGVIIQGSVQFTP